MFSFIPYTNALEETSPVLGLDQTHPDYRPLSHHNNFRCSRGSEMIRLFLSMIKLFGIGKTYSVQAIKEPVHLPHLRNESAIDELFDREMN